MSAPDIYFRRNLPHYHLVGYPLFITFRLAGSLPKNVLVQLKMECELELSTLKVKSADERRKIETKYFESYDSWLDRCEFGPDWLQVDGVAQIVANEIRNLDGDRYHLMAYCIMPNHVHLLIEPLTRELADNHGRSANYPVPEIMRLIKGRTARYANLELQRSGSFWQHESYDHVVRDEQEAQHVIQYILNNPVKPGLVNEWKSWPYTYISPELGKW